MSEEESIVEQVSKELVEELDNSVEHQQIQPIDRLNRTDLKAIGLDPFELDFLNNLISPDCRSIVNSYEKAYNKYSGPWVGTRRSLASKAHNLRKNARIQAALDLARRHSAAEEARDGVAVKRFVSERLRMESTGEGVETTAASRVRALELMGKSVGMFERGKTPDEWIPEKLAEIETELEELMRGKKLPKSFYDDRLEELRKEVE